MDSFLQANGRFKGFTVETTEKVISNSARALGLSRNPDEDIHAFNERVVAAERERMKGMEAGKQQSAGVAGLPVSGYKKTQPPEAIAAVNVFKELEERALRHADRLMEGATDNAGDIPVEIDPRWMAIGRTQLQQAFMALNRAIFQPERVKLPEDE